MIHAIDFFSIFNYMSISTVSSGALKAFWNSEIKLNPIFPGWCLRMYVHFKYGYLY